MDYNHHLLHSYNPGFFVYGREVQKLYTACQLGSPSESSPKLQDKMLDGKPGYKATGTPCLSSHCLPQKVLLNRQILLHSLLVKDDYNCQQYNCRHNEKDSNSKSPWSYNCSCAVVSSCT